MKVLVKRYIYSIILSGCQCYDDPAAQVLLLPCRGQQGEGGSRGGDGEHEGHERDVPGEGGHGEGREARKPSRGC